MINIEHMYRSILDLHKQINSHSSTIKSSNPRDREILIHILEKIKRTQQRILEILSEVKSQEDLVLLSVSNRVIDNCEYIVTCLFKNLELFIPFHISQIDEVYHEFIIQTIETQYCTYVDKKPYMKFLITIYKNEAQAVSQGDIRKRIYFNTKTRFLDNTLDYQFFHLLN